MFAGLVPGGRDVDVDCDAEERPVVLAEPQIVVAPLPCPRSINPAMRCA